MRNFRGKRVGDNIWIYGDLLHGIDQDCHIQNLKDGVGPNKYRGPQEVIPESVGQSTGLKDKEGVKIYGGDIVAQVHPNGFHLKPFTIYWRDASAAFGARDKDNNHYILDREIYAANMKVIGNTTDNPKLLEAEAGNCRRESEIE